VLRSVDEDRCDLVDTEATPGRELVVGVEAREHPDHVGRAPRREPRAEVSVRGEPLRQRRHAARARALGHGHGLPDAVRVEFRHRVQDAPDRVVLGVHLHTAGEPAPEGLARVGPRDRLEELLVPRSAEQAGEQRVEEAAP